MKSEETTILKPSGIELTLVVLTGIGHVGLELAADGMRGAADSLKRPQHVYNLVAVAVWGLYLLWKVTRTRGVLRAWGFRTDGFGPALKSSAVFTALAMIPLTIYGALFNRFPLPATFWLVFALYPAWGLAQQFALQALITTNLRETVPRLHVRIFAAALIFSASHFPNFRLMALTFAAGLVFTWIYEQHRNLWAVGLAHGVLGAVVYYVVLGQDPGRQLAGLFGGGNG